MEIIFLFKYWKIILAQKDFLGDTPFICGVTYLIHNNTNLNFYLKNNDEAIPGFLFELFSMAV